MILPRLIILSVLTLALAKWTPPSSYELAISPNGHYLVEPDGTPFFWQADTAWLLTHTLNFTETETYLADRAAKGYNVVLNVGFTQIGIDSPNRNGDLTFIDEDVNKPNEAYWDYIDDVVELAWTKYNIRMALIPAWGYYAHDGTDPDVFTPENGEAFGHFIGRRYPYLPKLLFADTNPFWADQDAIVDEYTAGGIPGSHPSVDFRGVYDAVGKGIVAGEREATHRGKSWWPLLSMHPRNQWMPDAPPALASSNLGDRAYLTFDAAQSGHVDLPPHPPIPWWNARRGYETVEVMYKAVNKHTKKARPAIDNEPHYERRWTGSAKVAAWNASDVRAGSWQTALSGAAGVTYGNDMVMQMYDPARGDPPTSGMVKPWYEAVGDEGAAQIQVVRSAVLDRKNAGGRVPAQDVVVGDAGLDDKRVTAMRDAKGSWIMVYTPTGEDFTIDVSGLKGGQVKASWLNPLDGTYTKFKFDGSSTEVKFTPPEGDGHDDWTLVLETK